MTSLILTSIKSLGFYEATKKDLKPFFDKRRPYFGDKSKSSFNKWTTNLQTDWIFYSGFSALDPHNRTSRENPVYHMDAFVVDYDFKAMDEEYLIKSMTEHSGNGGITPRYISKTFSGGVRAVWAFEKPVTVFTNEIAEELLIELIKYTKARFLYPGLDERATKNVKQFYEFGSDWTEFEDIEPIKEETLNRLLVEAIKRAKKYYVRDGNLPKLPFDVVYEEVTQRFPGRWQGEFDLNARGCRFWDPDADALSAVVKPEGMLCYTGEKKFVSWSEIFGQAFVNKFLDDKIGAILKGIYTDGKSFFVWMDHLQSFKDYNVDQIRWKFASDHGISDSKEQNFMLNKLLELNRVEAALPVVLRPTGIIQLNGERVLNIWKNQLMRMSEEDRLIDPATDFPFLYKLWFEDGFNPHEQLDYFLAWVKRFYKSAIELKPCRGQVLIIAGSPSAGKTFTSQYILGKIFGGCQDASGFFSEGGFNSHMFQSVLWNIDDSIVSSRNEKKLLYSGMLKKAASDSFFQYNEKFRKGGMIEWSGRVIVTCNDDPDSLSAIPFLNVSNEDKVMLLKMGSNIGKFEGCNPEEETKKELPYFLRWLMKQWTEPKNVLSKNPRYGVVSYKHEDIFEDSKCANNTSNIEEILDVYFQELFSISKDDAFDLNTTELLERLQSEGSPVSATSRYITARALGMELTRMHRSSVYPKKVHFLKNRKYRIHKEAFQKTALAE